jgi:hypothetical protein
MNNHQQEVAYLRRCIDSLREQVKHQHGLIAEYEKRVQVLEIQEARFGLYCPPHIVIEIKDTKQQIQGAAQRIEELGREITDIERRIAALGVDSGKCGQQHSIPGDNNPGRQKPVSLFVVPEGLKPRTAATQPPTVPAQPLDPTLFTKLSELLAAGQWQEADRETINILLRIAHREQSGSLLAKQIKALPCEALVRSDTLWSQASNGRFGFSAQMALWRDVASQQHQFDPNSFRAFFRAFGDRVGWRIDGDWRRYNQFLFTTDAPTAHLPTLRVRASESSSRWWNEWVDNLKEFIERFKQCLPQA